MQFPFETHFLPEIPFQQTYQQLNALAQLLEPPPPQLAIWRKQCTQMEARLAESILRIAVVGVVKSGKSSLVNALIQQDLLRRGAGILTSQITKIRRGQRLSAQITFKSQPEIEQEFQTAFAFLCPFLEADPDWIPSLFKSEDRKRLQTLLANHPLKIAEQQDHWLAEYTQLVAFLRGFAEVASYLHPETYTLTLSEEDIRRHHQFVARDELAIYLHKVLLEVPTWFATHCEIADCQGIDSPNPFHFSHVQEYLRSCSWVIYVISSRTGIRQADFKLLKTLQQFELLPQTLFVVNLDLNEHESEGRCSPRVGRH